MQRRLAAAEYEVTPDAGRLQAPNRAQNLRAGFHETGVEIQPREADAAPWRWTWRLAAWGREDALVAAEPVPPMADARRVEYRRPGLVEWYENSEAGLEQGFTIAAPPAGEGALCIDGEVGGDLAGHPAEDAGVLHFHDRRGARVLRYGKLLVRDAAGRMLPATMTLAAGAIRLRVDDRDAVYPVTVDPLLDTPDWIRDGYQDYANFGYCVATAGDVDGDGYSDVLVAAPAYSSGGSAKGRVWVYRGGPAGLATDFDWTFLGDQQYATLGSSAACAGDVNGDGYDDVVVAAPYYDDDHETEGRVYVFHGGPDGLGNTPDWVHDGDEAYGCFGISVAAAGDVDGDGYGDLIVGADEGSHGQSHEGLAYVFRGSASGLGDAWAWRGESNVENGGFGCCVSTAGDVNADGYDDVLVGASSYDSGGVYGHAYVFHGSASGLATSPAWEIGSPVYAHFGSSVATAGDVDGDGYGDVLVAAKHYTNGQEHEGRVYLYRGHQDGLSADPVWHTEGDQTEAHYGWCAASAGVVDGDGFGDVIIGATEYDSGGGEPGRAYVFHGSRSGPRAAAGWVTESNQAQARYGATLACVGDVDGDGYSDVIVGAPRWDGHSSDNGCAFVWYGQASPPPAGNPTNHDWATNLMQSGGWWGYSVAGAGDVDGDGYGDILVGTPYYESAAGADAGLAALWYGSASGILHGAAAWLVEGAQAGSHYAWTVGAAGDVNGDGFGDILVGSRTWTAGQSGEGRAFLYYGNDSRGRSRCRAQWRRDLSAPVSTLGLTGDPHAFVLRAHGRSAIGRSQVRMEYEVKPFGVAFDGNGTALGPWTDTGPVGGALGSVAELSELVDGLTAGAAYHWRLRVHTDDPFFPCSPWLTLADNAVSEMDLRTGPAGTPVADRRPVAAAGGLRAAPNPFNPRTTLEFALDQPGRVRLDVLDVQGRLLRVLLDEERAAGAMAAVWDGRDDAGRALPSGVYVVRLRARGKEASRKVTMVR